MSKEYDSKRHAANLQYMLNMIVGFLDVRTLQEIIDYYVELEADEGDYTDVFRVLDIALTDWLSNSDGADEKYVQQAERVKNLLTMTRDERGELYYADKPYSHFNHSSTDEWKPEDYHFLEEEHNLTKADALAQIEYLRRRHRL